MNSTGLPLLDLFNRLRDHGLPLGVDDYIIVLRALQAGFGVESPDALAQLCCTLWIKSSDEAKLFQYFFNQLLPQSITHLSEPDRPEPLLSQPETLSDTPPASTPIPELPQSNLAAGSPFPSTAAIGLGDEPIQVVQAVRHKYSDNWNLNRPRFSLFTDYFPVTRRQMKQSWRHLRRPVREGPPVELDIQATIERIGREGLLLEPMLMPRRSNRAELVLLVDQDGSMVPFHSLSRQLIETAQRGGRLGQTSVYYFHDYVDTHLYLDPARLIAQSVPEALAAIGKRAVVLIISDAGAARGNLDIERVERTKVFLEQLNQSVRRYAWLNPMPRTRWTQTSAGEITLLVPMFELSRFGLDAAISTLRGRYVHWEKFTIHG